MLIFILRRVALGLVTVVTAVIIVTVLMHLMPGSPGAVLLGSGASQEQIDAVNESLGWNRPFLVQLLDYLAGLLRWDFGVSLIDGRSVGADLLSRLQVTGIISLIATVIAAMLGTALGMLAAARGGAVDRIITAANGIAMSLPSFWVAVLVAFLFAVQLRWLPATGYVAPGTDLGGWLASVTLPVIALAIAPTAVVARTAKVALLQAFALPSTLMLRSVGTSPARLLFLHSLRAASIPIVSMVGLQFVTVFSATIIVEGFFGLPGLGPVITTAVTLHDIPVIEGVVVVTAGLIVLLILALDLVVGVLDPRVRHR